MGGQLQLTWHSHCADIPESLWASCCPPPHEGLFWFRALESGNLGDQFRFLFGLLECEGAAIGIVPAFVFDVPLKLVIPPRIAACIAPLARGPLRGLAHQRTFFIGNVAGEEGRVGLVPGYRLHDVAAFVHAGARAKADECGAPMLVWKDFPDPDRKALDLLLDSTRTFRMVSYPGTAIELVRGGYAAFLRGMRSDKRRGIGIKLRRGEAAIPVTTSIVSRPDARQVEEIFRLFWLTYLRGTTKFERLTPEFFRAIACCEEVSFIIQREPASGKTLAFMMMLALGERAINQFIGIDYAASKGGYLTFRLFAAAYDWACATGATVLQSGQTGYKAKLDMGHRLVPLWNYAEHRNPLVNWVFRRAAAGIGWETLDGQLAEYLSAHPALRPN